MEDDLDYLLKSFLLTLICNELRKGNEYCIGVSCLFEVLWSHLLSTDRNLSTQVGLHVAVGREAGGIAHSRLLKDVVYEVVVLVIVRASICQIRERHQVFNGLCSPHIDIIVDELHYVYFGEDIRLY